MKSELSGPFLSEVTFLASYPRPQAKGFTAVIKQKTAQYWRIVIPPFKIPKDLPK
jgi:hypothetical protein